MRHMPENNHLKNAHIAVYSNTYASTHRSATCITHRSGYAVQLYKYMHAEPYIQHQHTMSHFIPKKVTHCVASHFVVT